jgi:hypothetical protein
VETFYKAWEVVTQFLAADARVPKGVALTRPPARTAARHLADRVLEWDLRERGDQFDLGPDAHSPMTMQSRDWQQQRVAWGVKSGTPVGSRPWPDTAGRDRDRPLVCLRRWEAISGPLTSMPPTGAVTDLHATLNGVVSLSAVFALS